MFYQIFLSPTIKRWAKHGIYELPHELPKNLRLNLVFGHILVHSVDKTHVLVVSVELIVVVLKYTFFQFCSNTEQIS